MRHPLLACVLLGSGLAGSDPAWGHRLEHPKTLRLGVRDDRLVLAVSLDVSPGPEAVETRSLFDRDASGTLDEGEQARLLAALEQRAWRRLKVSVDGAPVTWTQQRATPHRLDRRADDHTTLGASWLYEAVLGPSRRVTLRVEDRASTRRGHVPLRVDVMSPWRIRSASQGIEEQDPDSGQSQVRGIELSAHAALVLSLGHTSAPDP